MGRANQRRSQCACCQSKQSNYGNSSANEYIANEYIANEKRLSVYTANEGTVNQGIQRGSLAPFSQQKYFFKSDGMGRDGQPYHSKKQKEPMRCN